DLSPLSEECDPLSVLLISIEPFDPVLLAFHLTKRKAVHSGVCEHFFFADCENFAVFAVLHIVNAQCFTSELIRISIKQDFYLFLFVYHKFSSSFIYCIQASYFEYNFPVPLLQTSASAFLLIK